MSPSPQTGRVGRRDFLKAGAAAAGLTLTGCSAAAQARAPLEFWNFYAPAPQEDPNIVAQSDWFLDRIDTWNANNDQSIESVYIPAYTDPSNTRLATAFASGAGPDIFLVSPGDFLRYYNGGALLDLAPYLDQDVIGDYFPEALSTRQVGAGIYGLPMEQEPLAIFYDIPAFEEAGLAEGDLPTTWEDMLEIGRRLTGGQRAGLVLETVPGYYQNFTFYPWLWQGGGDVIDVATQSPVFDSEAGVQALEMFGDAVRSGASPRTLPANGDLVGAFTGGLAGMWQSGIWIVEEFRQNAPDHPYGVMPLPAPPGGESITALGGWAWCVNALGPDPQNAARFVAEVMGSMSAESIQAGVEWNGVVKGNIPARQSVLDAIGDDDIFADPIMQTFRDEIYPTGRGEPRFPPVLYKAVSDALQRVQLAGGDPYAEAALADSAVESFMETYEGGELL